MGALGFVTTLGMAVLAVVVFFAAYFVAYEPYRALYPDLLDDAIGSFLALVPATATAAAARPTTAASGATCGDCAVAILASVPILGRLRERADADGCARN